MRTWQRPARPNPQGLTLEKLKLRFENNIYFVKGTPMNDRCPIRRVNRRRFLQTIISSGVAAGGVWDVLGAELPPLSERPQAPDHTLVVVSGTPRERGRATGGNSPTDPPIPREGSRGRVRLAQGQSPVPAPLRGSVPAGDPPLSPTIVEEMEGMAEGSGLRLEEIVLLTLQEELWHRGEIPGGEHCTATAVGPPVTADGNTYVALSWDWFGQLYGKSQMLLWERKEGPSVLSYSYPGLWIGAGVNSAGIALAWTSIGDIKTPTLAVGVPSYVLIAHLLYQPTLEAVEEEARRAGQAGWFTFVMADSSGQLLNIESSPEKIAIERHRGSLVRVYYGTPRDDPHTARKTDPAPSPMPADDGPGRRRRGQDHAAGAPRLLRRPPVDHLQTFRDA